MRKVFFTLLMIACASSLTAQSSKKHELSIGVGISSGELPNNLLENGITEMLGGENQISTDDKKRSGFYVSYKYHFNKRWALGTSLTYKHLKKENTQNNLTAKYRQNFYGINVEGQYTYLSKRIFRMYALVGAGIYICKEQLRWLGDVESSGSDRTIDFTYQVSPLCFEVGRNVGAKMEYGYGYKGIGSVGFYVRF